MIQLPTTAEKLIAFFKKNEFECYVVGGYVRDQILLKQNKSAKKLESEHNNALDFATNATPEEMLQMLPEGKYENVFGSVLFSLAKIAPHLKLKEGDYYEGEYIEVTTYRTEQGYADKRHPDVVSWGKTIQEDLIRRDFTINAMAYDGVTLIDPHQGQLDIEKKIIRTVGDPDERLREDALRMMRAVRFACTLGFVIEEKTLWSISHQSSLLEHVSFERIRDEFLKILGSPHPKEGVLLLKNTNLLNVFLPELYECFGVGQVSPKRHHIYDVGTHLLNTLEACINPKAIVRLACLLHDIGKPATRKILESGVVTFYNHEIVGTQIVYEIAKRLRLSKKDLIKLTTLVRYHQFVVSTEITDNALRRFIREVGMDNLSDMLDLRVADRIGSGSTASSWRLDLFKKRLVEVQQKPFTVHDLNITGEDVMRFFKIKPSKKVGDILDSIFQDVVDGKVKNEKKELLEYLKQLKN